MALGVAAVLTWQKSDRVHIPLFNDEGYHVTDALVKGEPQTLNPFHKDYTFLGHPPGYPISMYLWLKVFSPQLSTAKYHALFFSLLTLMAFFLFCWLYMEWPLALICMTLLSLNHNFDYHAVLCLADIPSLSFLFLTLFFLGTSSTWLAAVVSFFMILFRESTIALSISLFLSTVPDIIKTRQFLIKPLFGAILTPFIFIAFFFTTTYFIFGQWFTHPYATGQLDHTNVKFFSLGYNKLHSFINILNIIRLNLPPYSFLLIFIGIFSIFKQKCTLQQSLEKSLLLTTLFYILFFALYADTIERDLLPATTASLFFIARGIQYLFRQWTFLPLSAFLLIHTLPGSFIEDHRFTVNMSLQALQFIEKNYSHTKVCSSPSLRSAMTQNIMGYVNKQNFTLDCSSPDIILDLSFATTTSRDRYQKFISSPDYELKKIIQNQNNSTESIAIYIRKKLASKLPSSTNS